jgi:2-amino-4-hydroxy-6-hydroxymethyldihydropteridine diphosphokinase
MSAERVFVGLGANLGDARDVVLETAHQLDRVPHTRRVAQSSLYRSAPVDAAGPDFINAVVELRTALDPIELLSALQDLERAKGRQRPYRHAPRTLDLDLLLFGQRQLEAAQLTLPHPRLHERAFVLQPLLEIEPLLAHPSLGPLGVYLEATSDQLIERLP